MPKIKLDIIVASIWTSRGMLGPCTSPKCVDMVVGGTVSEYTTQSWLYFNFN